MAKYHGMVIYTPHGRNGNGKRKQSINSLANHAIYYYNNMKFYIHPDSLHLLEHQHGDINSDGDIYGNETNWFNYDSPIIQRNGLPFMWPDSEEA